MNGLGLGSVLVEIGVVSVLVRPMKLACERACFPWIGRGLSLFFLGASPLYLLLSPTLTQLTQTHTPPPSPLSHENAFNLTSCLDLSSQLTSHIPVLSISPVCRICFVCVYLLQPQIPQQSFCPGPSRRRCTLSRSSYLLRPLHTLAPSSSLTHMETQRPLSH